jgi:hypothetical protein
VCKLRNFLLSTSVSSASASILDLNISNNTMFSNPLIVHALQVTEFYARIDSVQDYGCLPVNV